MKRSTVVALCLAVGLLGGMAAKAAEMGHSHQVSTEIVSIDMKANTITIKDDKGESKTVPVLGTARESLKNLRVGEKVTLTCKDNEKGEHEGVAAIKVEAPAHKG
jgi:hypothetical protein